MAEVHPSGFGEGVHSYACAAPLPLVLDLELDPAEDEGVVVLYARALDAAGNVSNTALAQVELDATAPQHGEVEIAGGAAYTTTSTVALTLDALDGGSGVHRVYLDDDSRPADGLVLEYAPTVRAYALGVDAGTATVWALLEDRAGNRTASPSEISDSIVVDGAAPSWAGGGLSVASLQDGEDDWTSSAEVMLTVPPGAGEDLDGLQMRIANDPQLEAATWEAWSWNRRWTLAGDDGSKTVYAQLMDAAGNVSPSRSATIELNVNVPEAPGGVLAEAGNGAVALRWGAVVNDLAGYVVHWGTNEQTVRAQQAFTWTSCPGSCETTEHVFADTDNGTTYYFAVQAVDERGQASEMTEVVAATPELPAPEGVEVLGEPGQIVVSWQEVDGATAYNVYYDLDYAGAPYDGTLAAEGDSPIPVQGELSLELNGLRPETTYYVAVSAVDEHSESALSDPDQDTTMGLRTIRILGGGETELNPMALPYGAALSAAPAAMGHMNLLVGEPYASLSVQSEPQPGQPPSDPVLEQRGRAYWTGTEQLFDIINPLDYYHGVGQALGEADGDLSGWSTLVVPWRGGAVQIWGAPGEGAHGAIYSHVIQHNLEPGGQVSEAQRQGGPNSDAHFGTGLSGGVNLQTVGSWAGDEPRADLAVATAGRRVGVYRLSGSSPNYTFLHIHTIDPGLDVDRVAVLPDLDGDGDGEIAVADTVARDVRIRLGGQWSQLWRLEYKEEGDHALCTAGDVFTTVSVPDSDDAPARLNVGAAGDIDGDGSADMAVTCEDPGWLLVYSVGRAGARAARVWQVSDQCASSVAPIGDLDGDGVDELAVGCSMATSAGFVPGWRQEEGGLVIYSHVAAGRPPRRMYETFGDQPASGFGHRVEAVGDWDDDGWPDVAVSAPRQLRDAAYGYGRVYILSGGQLGLTPFKREAHLPPGARMTLEGTGGSGLYSYSLLQAASGAASVSNDGEYVAGPNEGSDIVQVTDSKGRTFQSRVLGADPPWQS